LFNKLMRWASFRHLRKTNGWRYYRYWRRVGAYMTFSDGTRGASPMRPTGINLRGGRLEIVPVGAERRSVPGRPPARMEASTLVDARLQAPGPKFRGHCLGI